MNREQVEILEWPLAHLPRANLQWADLRWPTQSRRDKMAKKRKNKKKVWTVNLIISVPDKDREKLIADLEHLIDEYARTSTLVITPEVRDVKT